MCPANLLTVISSSKACGKESGALSPGVSASVAESLLESCSSKTLLRAKPWLASAPKSLNCGQQTGMPPLQWQFGLSLGHQPGYCAP